VALIAFSTLEAQRIVSTVLCASEALILNQKSAATLFWFGNQTQYGFWNKEMATPFLCLV